MYCQKWNISFVFGVWSSKNNNRAVRKRHHRCGFKAPTMDILPQWRLLQQDILHFQNEQLQLISSGSSRRCWRLNSIHLPSLNIRYCPHPHTHMDIHSCTPLLSSFWREWKGVLVILYFQGRTLWWDTSVADYDVHRVSTYTHSDSDTQAVSIHTPPRNLFSLIVKNLQTDG